MTFDHRICGAVTLARYGREHFAALGQRSRPRVYGDSEAARRQWMRDLRQKRELVKQHGAARGTALWTAMVERHKTAFSVRREEEGHDRTQSG